MKMNKERFHKAIDKVFDKLSKMIKEEFYNELEKHKDGDFQVHYKTLL